MNNEHQADSHFSTHYDANADDGTNKDCHHQRKRCIQLIDEDIKGDTICWTFGSTIKNNTYSLSLLKTNESVNLLLQ